MNLDDRVAACYDPSVPLVQPGGTVDRKTDSDRQEPPSATECAKWLKALGEPIRLEIVRQLLSGPLTVTTLTEKLETEIATASHHLQVLLHAGLVRVEKTGRFSNYSLNPEFLKHRSAKDGTLDFGCCRFNISTAPK